MHFQFNTTVNTDYQKFLNNIYPSHTFIVLIHAKWCGHCVHLLKDDGPWVQACANAGLDIVEIESDIFKHLQEDHPSQFTQILEQQVQGYPTILKFHKNKEIEHFQGQRNKDDLEKFMSTPQSATAAIAKKYSKTKK